MTRNKDMKVLLINGSPRKNGNTHIALTEVAKTLEANDIQAEIDVQDEIIKRNTQTANTFEARIKAARQAAKKVDNMIKSKEGK